MNAPRARVWKVDPELWRFDCDCGEFYLHSDWLVTARWARQHISERHAAEWVADELERLRKEAWGRYERYSEEYSLGEHGAYFDSAKLIREHLC